MPRQPETIARIKRDKRLPETRVTSGELETIKQRAADTGKSLSDFQRDALLTGAIVIRQNAFDVKTVNQLIAIGGDIRRIGVNINQITKKLNARNDINPARLYDTLATLDSILEPLEKLTLDLLDDT